MEDIVKKLMENHRLDEMAMERKEAIMKCSELGKVFIEHFHKVYTAGVSDDAFDHHCQEMQSWYDDIRKIVLKSNKRGLSNNQMIDWFFTNGSSTEYLFDDEDEVEEYNEFMVTLLSNRRSGKVVDILRDQLSN